MNVGSKMMQAKGKALDRLAHDRAGVERIWGETDESLRQRTEALSRQASISWIKSPPAQLMWWARAWHWYAGPVPPEHPRLIVLALVVLAAGVLYMVLN